MVEGAKSPIDHYNSHKENNIQKHLTSEQLSVVMRHQLQEFRKDYCIHSGRGGDGKGLAVGTQESYIRSMAMFGYWLMEKGKEDFKKAKRADLENYLTSISSKSNSIQDWYKIAAKVFYRWLLDGKVTKKDPFPEIVDWISIGYRKPTEVERDDCLTPDQVRRMLAACTNPRDRALVHLMFETGGRINEILNIQVKHLHLGEEYPYVKLPISKTTPRIQYLLDSVNDIRGLLEQHPDKNEARFSESFLFGPLKGEENPFLTTAAAYDIIQRVGHRASIKKKIWPHLFRHTSITNDLAMGMPTPLVAKKHGLADNSPMLSRYGHVQMKDVANFYRRLKGVEVKQDDTIRSPRKCPRCQRMNDWDKEYCGGCSAPLDESKYRLAVQNQASVQDQMQKMQEQLDKLMVVAAHGTVAKAKEKANQE